MSASILETALEYAEAGYYVFPVRIALDPETGKKDATFPPSWPAASTRDPERIRRLFSESNGWSGVAIDTGRSGVTVVDLDTKPDKDGLTAWEAHPAKVDSPMTVTTWSGGRHIFLRTPEGVDVRNSADEVAPGVDVRGAGGLVFAAPTEVGGSGRSYRLDGELVPVAELPELTPALVETFGRAAAVEDDDERRIFDEAEAAAILADRLQRIETGERGYRASIYGYALARSQYAHGTSDEVDLDALRECIADAVLEASPWTSLDGDDLRWIEDGISKGQDRPWEVFDSWTDWIDEVAEEAAEASSSSWAPLDVRTLLSEDYEPEETTILRRADEVALFYPGRVHWLAGESESGKSWVALLAVAEVLKDEGRALFVDFESDLQTVGGRLLDLGVDLDVIVGGLTYVRPDERPMPGLASGRAFEAVLGERYNVAVIDGVTDAFTVYNLDPNNSTESATFLRALARPIAEQTGAAVIAIDHVTKSSEGRGRFAIGSQHKMAGLDGIAYTVEPIQAIAPGREGVIGIRVAKDRPGWVRRHAGAWSKKDRTQEAARITLDSTGDGTEYLVDVPETYDPDTESPTEWRPTYYMEKVSRYLEAAGASGASRTTVKRELGGKHEHRDLAVTLLIEDGFVEERPRQGQGGGTVLVSVRPFQEDWPN